MASFLFDHVPKKIAEGDIRLDSEDFTAVLVTAAPTSTALETFEQLTNVVSGGNYEHQAIGLPGDDSSKSIVDRPDGGITVKRKSPTWEALATSDNAPITGIVLVEGSGYIYDSSDLFAYIERVEGTTPTPFVPDGSKTLLFSLLSNGIMEMY